MKITTTLPPNPMPADPQLAAQLRGCLDELTLIRKVNRTADAEIRQLRTATRKAFIRIRENLRHVKATH